MFRPLVAPTVASAALAGLFACVPIQFGAADLALRDGGELGPVLDLDARTSGSADAGAGPAVTPSAGFRAACGVISVCAPDDASACAGVLARDGGAYGDAGFVREDASAGDSGDGGDSGEGSNAGDGGNGLDATSASMACRLSPTRAATTCAPAGPGGAHANCSTDDECAAGFACAAGTCEHLCCDERARCAPESACVLAPHSGQGQRFVPVCAPRRACAFTWPDRCPSDTQCGFAADDGSSVCLPLGPGRDGASCALAPCAAGFACIGATNAARCAKTCDPTSSTVCPAGQRCRAHPALFGTAEVGYCSPNE